MKVNFKKKFGQNFLSDTNLLSAIVRDSGISASSTVVEVGPGAGAMTKELCKVAKKVVAFEIDTDLKEILQSNLAEAENVIIVFEDFLKVSKQRLNNLAGTNFDVVANLPYYITSPIITKFLTCGLSPNSITIMVQKEVGERIVAMPKTKDYGVLSIMVQLCGTPKIARQVDRKMFTPSPNVDSVIVHVSSIKIPPKYEQIIEFVKKCFSSRRKTLVNNLRNDFSKDKIEQELCNLNLDVNVRAEELTSQDFCNLYAKLY